jgi:hypothetical protein
MPRPFSQTLLRVKIAGFDMIDDIIDDLNKQDKNASMSLAKSLKLETAETAGIVSVRFKAKSHWKYVDGGRKKGTRPPIGPLQRWVQVKLGKDEEDSKRMAYAIANNIKKNGIKPTYIFRNNVDKFKSKLKTLILKTGKEDVTKEIRKILNR